MGVGLLGQPEREPASAWLIAHLGVLWGMTMLHGAAAAGFAGLGALARRLGRWPGRRRLAGVIGIAVAIGYAGLLLGQTVVGNMTAIAGALARR